MPRKTCNNKKRGPTSKVQKNKAKKTKTSQNLLPTFNMTIREFQKLDDPCFSHFEQDPENATLLYYLNSGLFRFHELDRLPSANAKQNLIAEIQTEPPTQEEVHKILRQFFEHRAMYPQQNFPSESFKLGKILACGLCGISLPEQNNWSYKRD